MIAYDEFETFRSPKRQTSDFGLRSGKSGSPKSSPERVEALDDLHRALYGSVHPAAAIVESDRELVEGDDSDGSVTSWEQHGLTAALAVAGCIALYSWFKRPKETPLHGPPDVPLTPSTP